MPSLYHHFYVLKQDIVVELTWPAPSPVKGASLLKRAAAALFGPDRARSPENSVAEDAFDAAVDLLVDDVEAACRAFTLLGYEVSVDSEPAIRCAA